MTKRRPRQIAFPTEGLPGRLRTLRLRKGWTQTQLAEAVGVHQSHVGRFERGASQPTADVLRRIADIMGVTADFLLHGTAEESARGRLEDRELLEQFQEVEKLPQTDKEVIKSLLDAFLVRRKVHALTSR